VPDWYDQPWQGSGCYDTTIDRCPVTVCYCWRIVDLGGGAHYYDYVMTSLQERTDCGNDFSTLLNDAGYRLIADNPAGFPCPTTSPGIIYRFAVATCWIWHYISWGLISVPFFETCGGDAWCVQPYGVWCDNGVKRITPGTSTVTGSADCHTVAYYGGFPAETCVLIFCN